jgi:hypothetical protein
MNSQDVENHDVEKLHLESLQLRNQQFQLAAISLAGSGITAWIAPGLTALAQGRIPEIALVGGSIFWLVLLAFLYLWSLSLRAMIAVISQYLDVNEFTYWENHYRSFTEKTRSRFHRQTRFTAVIFTVYGIIATGGAFVAAWAAPEKVQLSLRGNIILLVSVVLYIVIVWVCYLIRNKNEIIKTSWKNIIKPTPDALK